MSSRPSDRLIDQRIRNRIMEALELLASGNAGVASVGTAEYFESFYDHIPHSEDGDMRPNAVITDEEKAALLEVRRVMDAACDATPAVMQAGEFISTGWPDRIQPVARTAHELMARRGRFREDREETEPSQR